MKRTHSDTVTDDLELASGSKRRRSRSVSSRDEVTQLDDDVWLPQKRPPPTGHELDRLSDHISLESFGKELQKAANAIFPDDKG